MPIDRFARSLSVFAIGFVLLMTPAKVFGHCDGMADQSFRPLNARLPRAM